MDEIETIKEATETQGANDNKKIVRGNLNSVIEKIKDIETEIKEAGFQIETEDYDFEDLYQIIIKIEK